MPLANREEGTARAELLWFAAAVVSVCVGVACLITWLGRQHFDDGQLLLDAGARFAAGEPIYQGSMLYPPAAAVLGSVLLRVPSWLGIEAALRVVGLMATVWVITRDASSASD